MTDPWEIRPCEGLGPFIFGMSPDATRSHAAACGGIAADYQSSPDSPEQLFASYAPRLGEEQARALVAEIQATGVDLRYRRTIGFPSSLALTFLEDSLDEVFCASNGTLLHVDGHRLFGKGVDPLPALRALQRRNGEPPLLRGDTCVFRHLHLTAFAIIAVAPDGAIGPRMKGRRLDPARTISWRATASGPRRDYAGYRPVDLGS